MDLLRPHILRRKEREDGFTDNNGDFILGASRWGDPVACRAEAGDGVKSVRMPGADGVAYLYAYAVYLDSDCPEFKPGDILGLFEQGADEPFAEMPCMGFRRKAMGARLWV